ncbi:FMN-binding protein [Ruminococcus flavefaciens]|uniref:FMN-binding protein n=1 Tax=Ruminococcus flavefaciens TaxID=1265 RepID=UPI00048D65FC|nr:FMN-binding protein [Ruminococcus flavefaciens]
MKDKVKPTLVLTVICVIASLLLVFAYELTKDRIADQKAQKFYTSAEALFGKTEYRIVNTKCKYDEVESIAVTSDKKTVIQVCADGYSKEGINILVGIDEQGAVSGIEFVSLGETPGLGSKVRDEADFRKQFYGLTAPSESFDAISGATFSSKGMKHAVDTALNAYNENKEAILGG